MAEIKTITGTLENFFVKENKTKDGVRSYGRISLLIKDGEDIYSVRYNQSKGHQEVGNALLDAKNEKITLTLDCEKTIWKDGRNTGFYWSPTPDGVNVLVELGLKTKVSDEEKIAVLG